MNKPATDCHVDIAITGGGIAGLWANAVLHHAGYQTILLEKNRLGSGQTLASQGIIHGGTKYALLGNVTGSSEAVRQMPERWKQHLAGQSFPDLSQVKLTTENQWMWDAGGISSKVSSFFASKVMSSRVKNIDASSLPDILKSRKVYELQEPVLDARSLIAQLAEINKAYIFQAEVLQQEMQPDGVTLKVKSEGRETMIHAGLVINTAGEGNESLQKSAMQRRPLQMVMIRGELPSLWGHIIEANANPRLTITSHGSEDGVVWYVGGQLAEDGANRTVEEQIEQAKLEIKALLPKLDLASLQWATCRINRAEGQQKDNRRPDTPVIKQRGRQVTVWPTKLVFAPLIGDELLGIVEESGLNKTQDACRFPGLTYAAVGQYPWEVANWHGGQS